VSTAAGLNPREAALVAALAAAPASTQQELAAGLGITDRYVRVLLAREPVRAALDEAAQTGLRETTALLGRSAARAARSLIGMATGDLPANPARVAACRAVLEMAADLDERRVLAERVRRLEDLLSGTTTATAGELPS
jgi:hypothetical protein